MTVRQAVLQALEAKRGESISGEWLAGELGVSRAAVWKAISTLRQEGYPIEAASNRGYRLAVESDLLSAEGIVPLLPEELRGLTIRVLDGVDSTNQEAKRAALGGAEHGLVLIAQEQT